MNAPDRASALRSLTSRLQADARELLLLDPDCLQNRVQQLHDAVQNASASYRRGDVMREELNTLRARTGELRRAAGAYRIIVQQALAHVNALLNARRYSRGLRHDQER